MSWFLAAWEKLPAAVRVALVALGGFLAALVAVFFRGKRAGRAEGAGDEARRQAEETRQEVAAAIARGDDSAVQEALRRQADSARRRHDDR